MAHEICVTSEEKFAEFKSLCCSTTENIPIPVTLTHISLASFLRDMGRLSGAH